MFNNISMAPITFYDIGKPFTRQKPIMLLNQVDFTTYAPLIKVWLLEALKKGHMTSNGSSDENLMYQSFFYQKEHSNDFSNMKWVNLTLETTSENGLASSEESPLHKYVEYFELAHANDSYNDNINARFIEVDENQNVSNNSNSDMTNNSSLHGVSIHSLNEIYNDALKHLFVENSIRVGEQVTKPYIYGQDNVTASNYTEDPNNASVVNYKNQKMLLKILEDQSRILNILSNIRVDKDQNLPIKLKSLSSVDVGKDQNHSIQLGSLGNVGGGEEKNLALQLGKILGNVGMGKEKNLETDLGRIFSNVGVAKENNLPIDLVTPCDNTSTPTAYVFEITTPVVRYNPTKEYRINSVLILSNKSNSRFATDKINIKNPCVVTPHLKVECNDVVTHKIDIKNPCAIMPHLKAECYDAKYLNDIKNAAKMIIDNIDLLTTKKVWVSTKKSLKMVTPSTRSTNKIRRTSKTTKKLTSPKSLYTLIPLATTCPHKHRSKMVRKINHLNHLKLNINPKNLAIHQERPFDQTTASLDRTENNFLQTYYQSRYPVIDERLQYLQNLKANITIKSDSLTPNRNLDFRMNTKLRIRWVTP
ncbi:unnamed protein product [Gordionus sp. m RMFG-2023]